MSYLNVVLVLWRELFEAMLIVTIVQAFLSRELANRSEVRQLIGLGIGAGVLLSLALGGGLAALQATLSSDSLDHFQTGVLIACAALMTHMCLWMQRHARGMKRELETSLKEALSKTRRIAVAALLALAIAREGFEAVVYLYGMGMSHSPSGLAAATGAALLLAVGTSYALSHGMKLVKPQVLFQVTGLFLLLTASSLVVTAVTRLLQAGAIPPLVDRIWDSSALLDDRTTIGSAVAGITGYQATPALITVLVYAGYWILYALAKYRSAASAAVVAATAAAAVMLWPHEAKAQSSTVKSNSTERVTVSGFGDIEGSYYDFGRNETLKNGAQKDQRVVLDATRFTAEIEGYFLPYDVQFEAELEIEHGGTGSEMDLEYEESGEYETEASKGGEVQLEEFYLKKLLNEHYAAYAGRILVAVGLLSDHNKPTDYLGVKRPEVETTLLPGEWTEMGLGVDADYEDAKVKLQVVNGLDSTGFSSQYWIARGHQGRFEEVSGTDPAGVARLDVTRFAGVVLGASGYYGKTSANRPQPDLVRDCNRTDESQVAPCGYVNAPVTIFDVHATVDLPRLTARSAVIWGKLQNADKISDRNARLSNNLHVLRSPVASEALGGWAEVGYDIGHPAGTDAKARVIPFLHYESYDTMYKVPSTVVKNSRFARRIAGGGVDYLLGTSLFAKLAFSRKTFGSGAFRPENELSVGTGFTY